jgi:hypothetical protein
MIALQIAEVARTFSLCMLRRFTAVLNLRAPSSAQTKGLCHFSGLIAPIHVGWNRCVFLAVAFDLIGSFLYEFGFGRAGILNLLQLI